jgi:hypothetical protein
MKRREILRYTALLTGAAVSAPLASTLLSGCKTDGASAAANGAYAFFNADEMTFIKTMIDTILPKTDSPSASEVGVDKMIDSMVGLCYPKESQIAYRSGFDLLKKYIGNTKDPLKKIMELESSDNQPDGVKDAYISLKQQTIGYYLSTEEIGTKFLNYLPVPGEFQPCIKLEEVGGKAWAI